MKLNQSKEINATKLCPGDIYQTKTHVHKGILPGMDFLNPCEIFIILGPGAVHGENQWFFVKVFVLNGKKVTHLWFQKDWIENYVEEIV